jgi:hypothetical protein
VDVGLLLAVSGDGRVEIAINDGTGLDIGAGDGGGEVAPLATRKIARDGKLYLAPDLRILPGGGQFAAVPKVTTISAPCRGTLWRQYQPILYGLAHVVVDSACPLVS